MRHRHASLIVMLFGYRHARALVSDSSRMAAKIAIVGGGISGSCAAAALASEAEVTVFDQGRRGPGGRASHRSVRASDKQIIEDDVSLSHNTKSTYEFDHGCQFFRADSEEMKRIVSQWRERVWVAPWEGSFGFLPAGKSDAFDFFGIASESSPVYIALGGMHQLPRRLLQSSRAAVEKGTRVCQIKRKDNQWELFGATGNQAYHDTNEATTDLASLGVYDAVVLTDISSASGDWHRASAGIPDELFQHLPKKVRMPLFSCMIAFEKVCRVCLCSSLSMTPLTGCLLHEAYSPFDSTRCLWFSSDGPECWTLISTPSYALQEITQDRETGAFKPQQNDYLNTVPGPTLFNAFLQTVQSFLTEQPNVVYMQAQRWGSGLPVAEELCDDIHHVAGDRFAAKLNKPLVHEVTDSGRDFVADDDLRLYYAGDFCSNRCPGFEAAALSGFHVAAHIKDKFVEKG
ncbi:uncharacterized protein FisN_16Lh223 [Fistulifera solaris]|uniref:Amine oxidase domain-containing protein n=1 Tax=Fistulifera solaris TaxID=1519565 RepID=A0A1Z5J6C2_FISSO|nr:uncharacterized protein FisN_16Lh223 [Fistulifera solaris]|eukprot:GAX09530.1 uncharacterized protein FisN_16Lh223 [Fistulifera solaris]